MILIMMSRCCDAGTKNFHRKILLFINTLQFAMNQIIVMGFHLSFNYDYHYALLLFLFFIIHVNGRFSILAIGYVYFENENLWPFVNWKLKFSETFLFLSTIYTLHALLTLHFGKCFNVIHGCRAECRRLFGMQFCVWFTVISDKFEC